MPQYCTSLPEAMSYSHKWLTTNFDETCSVCAEHSTNTVNILFACTATILKQRIHRNQHP